MTKLPRHKQASFIRWMKEHREEKLEYYRQRKREVRYGPDARESFDAAWKLQGGKCAICGLQLNSKSTKGDYKTAVALDHDHKTKKFRGILCRHCNFGIGNFRDSIEILSSAVKYLSDHEKAGGG
jgi:Recombination endonuclease VII